MWLDTAKKKKNVSRANVSRLCESPVKISDDTFNPLFHSDGRLKCIWFMQDSQKVEKAISACAKLLQSEGSFIAITSVNHLHKWIPGKNYLARATT